MNEYSKILSENVFSIGEFSIEPLRYQDIFLIMKWRNEQMYHLRQDKLLTEQDQEIYYEKTVKNSFYSSEPKQILFSFLKNGQLVGYGGLVHINWKKKEGEISFLINTEIESDYFNLFWSRFLKIIEEVSFTYLNFTRIFTYSYSIRKNLYDILNRENYILEKVIPNAKIINKKTFDIRIHSKLYTELRFRGLMMNDKTSVFEWSNDKTTRKNSINQKLISWENHTEWFNNRLNNPELQSFIFCLKNKKVGFLRLDKKDGFEKISFMVSPFFRGQGIGSLMIQKILNYFPAKKFIAEVLTDNINSNKIFLKNNFYRVDNQENNQINTYVWELQ